MIRNVDNMNYKDIELAVNALGEKVRFYDRVLKKAYILYANSKDSGQPDHPHSISLGNKKNQFWTGHEDV